MDRRFVYHAYNLLEKHRYGYFFTISIAITDYPWTTAFYLYRFK